ncbi:MAG: Ig domain protein group 2 domain protein [Acidobacteriaceae bacterium]|nr:Ig domain protein group 2 domain protein [Acidobacteriaceae bacterium]
MKSCFAAVFTILMLLFCGCGGGSTSTSSSTTASITITPPTATVATSTALQFTAAVQNASNTSVNWQVNGVTGGSATYGTISGSGLYTAPASVPSSPKVTITSVLAANSNITADASATIALPVVVNPSDVLVAGGLTQQFTATVNFSTNTGVTWQVNGVSGGNSSSGTIDSNGLYTAPQSVPTPSRVTITAVAKADTTRTASVTVTVTPAAVVITPADAIVTAGSQQAYSATVLSNAVKPVWSVTCPSTIPGACGSITSDGTYTAPSGPPPSALITIHATLADGSGSTGTVTATIQFGSSSLAGRYVFSIADDVGHAAPTQAGDIVFDGSGKISGGLFDSSDNPGVPISVTGGTYQIGSDGRGTAAIQTATGSFNLQLVLSSHEKAFIVRTDSTANQGAGTLELQKTISGTSALNGAYALSLSGFSTGTSTTRVTEAGSIFTASTGVISGGFIDLNNLTVHANSLTSGSFTQPSSEGRGTFTFSTSNGSQQFAYYAIDGTHAIIVAIDGTLDARGDLFSQPQGPFSSLALKGHFAFLISGANSQIPFGAAGVFTLDGSASVTDQQFDGLTQTVFDFNPGNYTVTDPTTGRTVLTWTANAGSRLQYVLYPRNDGGLVMLENDGVYHSLGVALQRDSYLGNFVVTPGSFALRLGGSESATPSVAERYTGEVRPATSSALTATIDGANISQGSAFALNLVNLNPNHQRYVFGTSADATLANRTLILYRVNDNQAFVIESNDTRVLVGDTQRQY